MKYPLTWLVGVFSLSYLLILVGSCVEEKRIVELPADDRITCDGLEPGSTQVQACQTGYVGQKIYICNKDGSLKLALDTCKVRSPEPPDCDIVSFEDVKTILSDNCVSCHFTPNPYDKYDVAKTKIDQFVRRVNLGSNNAQRMPKEPEQPLSIEEKQLLEKWRSDGLKEFETDCDGSGGDNTGYIRLFNIESSIIADLARVDQDDRQFTRYLVSSHKRNQGQDPDRLKLHNDSIQKNLNSLNDRIDDLGFAEPIDTAKTIWRFDLRSFDMTRIDWQLIEKFDPFDLESFTDEGETIKFLTGARKAWLHHDNFTNVSNLADVYYFITNTPNDLGDLLRKIGVNAGAQFRDFSAHFLGFNGSEISIQKNRMIVRFEADNFGGRGGGYAWVTFDPDSGINDGKNLFLNPCLNGTGCQALFEFAASEIIYTSPSGMQLYALYNAQGELQKEAPIDVVTDTRSPVSPIIKNAISCHRCHKTGILPSVDEVRNHILENGDQFNANDRQIILQLYKDRNSNNAAFQTDNSLYADALRELDINSAGPEPISVAYDELKLDWTVEEVAAFLFLPVEEFKSELRGSANGSAGVGQLLRGGSITFDQFVDILDDLKVDLRLFEEPL